MKHPSAQDIIAILTLHYSDIWGTHIFRSHPEVAFKIHQIHLLLFFFVWTECIISCTWLISAHWRTLELMAVTSPLSLRPWKKNSLIAWQTIYGLISISHFWFAWVLQPVWLFVSLPWTFGQEFLAWGRSLKLIGIFPRAEIFKSRID